MDRELGLPLPNDFLLSEAFIELNEAAYICTEWPKNMIMRPFPGYLESYKRGFLYSPKDKISKKALNANTRNLIVDLKQAIKNRELVAFPILIGLENIYGEEVSYFLPVSDLVKWILVKGYYLPNDMQDRLGLHQIPNFEATKPVQNAVRNKFIGQVIHTFQPTLSIDEIRDHPLMHRFGGSYQDKTRRAVFKDLLAVFGLKGGLPGTKTYVKKPLQPIPEVVIQDLQYARYCFRSLEIILEIAVKIKIITYGLDNISKMPVEVFLNLVLRDSLVAMYLQNASEDVLHLAKRMCYVELEEFYPHYKIQHIPHQQRMQMTIGFLAELSMKYYFESFTEEEKEKLQDCKSIF